MVGQERELAEGLAGPEFDRMARHVDDDRPLLDHEEPGPGHAEFRQDLSGRCVELGRAVEDALEPVVANSGEE